MGNHASSVSEIVHGTTTVQLTTGNKNSKQLTIDNCTPKEADELFNMLSDLVNTQFKGWYCRQFYKLSRTKVIELAAIAKADGKEPRKLFSILLKNV